jgi:hypothetical protein
MRTAPAALSRLPPGHRPSARAARHPDPRRDITQTRGTDGAPALVEGFAQRLAAIQGAIEKLPDYGPGGDRRHANSAVRGAAGSGVDLPLPKTSSVLVGATHLVAAAQQCRDRVSVANAGPGRDASLRHDGSPCCCDWLTWA